MVSPLFQVGTIKRMQSGNVLVPFVHFVLLQIPAAVPGLSSACGGRAT
jgi:hypothetical protein